MSISTGVRFVFFRLSTGKNVDATVAHTDQHEVNMPISFFRRSLRMFAICVVLPLAYLASQPRPAQAQMIPPAVVQDPVDNLRSLSPDLSEQYRAPEHLAPKREEDAGGKSQKPVVVTDEDVKANPHIAEIIINTAMQRRDWQTLSRVLALYRQAAGHDPLLVRYAEGALLRQQGEHAQAIEQFRQMLAQDDSLDYVRFDLAAILFEDRQYREARGLFADTADNQAVEQNFRALARQYQAQIDDRQRINKRLRLRLLRNDNVNQASDERFLQIGSWLFVKRRENMPRSSSGTNYALFLEQDLNLWGNHFVSWDVSVDGLNYFSEKAFNENALTVGLNYKWQDVRSWLYAGPVLDWRWLDGQRYTDGVGLGLGFGRWLTPRWQVTLHTRWLDRDYVDKALDDYDGDTLSLTPGVMWLLSQRSAVFGGLTYQRDKLGADTESFVQRGINGGFSAQWESGLNASGYVQVAFRRHDAGHSLFLEKRRDRRRNAVVNVGHAGLAIAGFEPKLGFQFEKVDSNISTLYSRTTRQWMLTLERRF